MDNATRRQILERVKQLGYPNTIEALQNPQVLDQYEQQLQAQSQQQQQPIQQQPVTFPTPPITTPNYKVPQPAQSEAKPLVMSFNETTPQLMKNGGPKDPPKKKEPRVISDPEEFKIANQAYQDSLDVYNLSRQIKPLNLPKISKNEYDRLKEKENNLPNWSIDKVGYEEDKKTKKEKDIKEYIYQRKNNDYNHPLYLKNNKKELNKYTNDEEGKYDIVLPNGSIKQADFLYEGKPDWTNYRIYNPKTHVSRHYMDNDLVSIDAPNIKPIQTIYYGKDELIPVGGIDLSEKWYTGKTLTKEQKDFWKNYSIHTDNIDVYKKPIQPIVFKPSSKPPLEKIEPLPIQKLPITSQPKLVSYDLPEVTNNKSTPIYQASQAHRTGQYQIGNNVWNEDKKKWERRLFKDSEERDWYFNQGKIKKYGGSKFEDGGFFTDPPPKKVEPTLPVVQAQALSTAVNPTGAEIFARDNALQVAQNLNALPENPPAYYPSDAYISGLRLQENAGKSGFNKNNNKWYSHASVEGGTNTIAYGHKLTKEEAAKGIYSKGITEEQANELLKKDLEHHLNNAKKVFNSKYGENAFDKVPNELKDVLVDYSYNGVLNKFNNFTQGIYNYSTATTPEQKELAYQQMLKEYQRKAGDKLLTSRNTWTKGMLESVPTRKYGGKKCYTCNSSKMKVLYNKANYKK